jgi:excisionase family DNA binding protein
MLAIGDRPCLPSAGCYHRFRQWIISTDGEDDMARNRADEMEPLLDINDAAVYLGTTVRHVRRMMSRGELATVKVGGKIRFEPADLRTYRRAQRTPATS